MYNAQTEKNQNRIVELLTSEVNENYEVAGNGQVYEGETFIGWLVDEQELNEDYNLDSEYTIKWTTIEDNSFDSEIYLIVPTEN